MRVSRRIVAAVLAAVTLLALIPIGLKIRERRRYTRARTQMIKIAKGLDRFYLDNGCYPTSDRGLAALDGPGGYELDKGILHPKPQESTAAPRDPWGCTFYYRSDGRSFVLGSFGAGCDSGLAKPEIVLTSRDGQSEGR